MTLSFLPVDVDNSLKHFQKIIFAWFFQVVDKNIVQSSRYVN